MFSPRALGEVLGNRIENEIGQDQAVKRRDQSDRHRGSDDFLAFRLSQATEKSDHAESGADEAEGWRITANGAELDHFLAFTLENGVHPLAEHLDHPLGVE